jgi:MoaA/NifB/PqqE/SkfB family radical SAM enzyme
MGPGFAVDIELTNRCNAKCHFCPRDQTPHQGIMSAEVFEQSLARAVEFRSAFPDRILGVNLCGLGEPLLNRNAATFVRQVRQAGFSCGMSSNASLLDEARGRALLDAGLQKISINVADRDEDYERVYKLKFQRTHDNIVRFAEMAADQCEVEIVLVNYRGDKAYMLQMQDYWRERGLSHFFGLEVMNRGGALFVDHMQFESFPELEEARALLDAQPFTPACAAPFVFLFIGYDGQYYLCCSDWKKEVPLGSVFDTSFMSIRQQKLYHVTCREPVCKTCNLDPTNKLTEELRSINAGEGDEDSKARLIAQLHLQSQEVEGIMADMDRAAQTLPVEITGRTTRRRISLNVK